MTGASVRLHEVAVTYGAEPALTGIDVSLEPGTVTAVLGPSGCGKTTLLRAIAGLEPVSSGEITIDDVVVSTARATVPPERRNVGLVPQDGALFPHLTVRKNIEFGLRGRPDRDRRVTQMLDLVELSDLEKRRPAELSGGQRQRVALARALAPGPLFIGLDEPFSALDAGLRGSLRREVRELLSAAGTTALLVTHDPVEAMAVADRLVVLLNGRVRQEGTPVDVCNDPADDDVAALFGGLHVDEQAGVIRSATQISLNR